MSALAQTNILKEMFSDDSRRDDQSCPASEKGEEGEQEPGVKQELSWAGKGKARGAIFPKSASPVTGARVSPGRGETQISWWRASWSDAGKDF